VRSLKKRIDEMEGFGKGELWDLIFFVIQNPPNLGTQIILEEDFGGFWLWIRENFGI